MASRPDNEVTVDFDVKVEVRDGVRLSADVYRPRAIDESCPVILQRTPYDKRSPVLMEIGQFYARRGYVFVSQDCRGRFGSEGDFEFLVQEPEDGYDTIEWCAAQPWSNGRIGTTGSSYAGWTQWAAAALAPPHLEAMAVIQGSTHPFHSGVRRNGAMELRFLAWGLMDAATNRRAMADPSLRGEMESALASEWLMRLPWRPGETPLARNPSVESWVLDLYTHGDWSEFWEQPGRGIANFWEEAADVPTLLMSGWYDSHNRGTFAGYIALTEKHQSPTSLIMGPWTHGRTTAELTFAGDVEFGPDASISPRFGQSVEHVQCEWFDRWLRGDDVDDSPSTRLFVMGPGRGSRSAEGRLQRDGYWLEGNELPTTEVRSWYLGPDGDLTTAPGDGGSTSWIYDPNDPVPTVGGGISSLNEVVHLEPAQINDAVPYLNRWISMVPIGGQDQATYSGGVRVRLADRPDVVSFTSAPLTEEVTVVGMVRAELFVSSDAPDTDITVKLVDVFPSSDDYPEGYELNICDSIYRLRYRNSWVAPSRLSEGEVARVDIEIDPTGCVFGVGHRIRLDLSSSNFPQFDPNPNTGEPIGQHTTVNVARNTVHHDLARPSRLILPVL